MSVQDRSSAHSSSRGATAAAVNAVYEVARNAATFHSASETLQWDERTGMPAAGGEYRGEQIAAIERHAHSIATAPEFGQKLHDASEALAAAGDTDSIDFQNLRLLRRDYDRQCRLPGDLVAEMARLTTTGQQLWQAARAENDFAKLAPTLKKIFDLKRDVGARFVDGTDREIYDGLLDEYEPDTCAATIADTFDALRIPLTRLIETVAASDNRPPVHLLERDYDTAGQKQLARWAAEVIGFNFDRGRLDETSHPFCTTLGPHDVRILTRYETDWLPAGLYASMHEAGHGIYEQGLPPDQFGLPSGHYASLGIHESQSRLWENQVGRSHGFCELMLPKLRQFFGSAIDFGVDELYAGVNTVRPSLIRVEADELTYNLHVIIRFDLERALIDGSLTIDDLPDAWNERYRTDLGIEVPNDADGCLQDVHWSAGLIGYFPTYTLGNLLSAQLFDAACADLGEDWGGSQAAIAAGRFDPLREWLVEHVHAAGRNVTLDELSLKFGGGALDAARLVSHLEAKVAAVYGA